MGRGDLRSMNARSNGVAGGEELMMCPHRPIHDH